MKIHDHACVIYRTREQQLNAVIPFISRGLAKHERCVYIADENTVAEVRQAMRATGIDVEKEESTGSLLLTDKRGTYLKHGFFDPDTMIAFLGDSTKAALEAGFTGLRGTGEMTWYLGGDPGSERLIEYEAKLNDFIPKHEIVIICQYNVEKFSSQVLMDVIRTHPIIIYEDTVCENLFYVPPNEFLDPGPAKGVERILHAITEQRNTTEALEQRQRQQQVMADISSLAMSGTPIAALQQRVVEAVAGTMEVEFAKVLELLPGGGELLLTAGVGWRPGLAGTARVGTDLTSQAGYTLLSNSPVVVENFTKETRFSGPPLLREHHVVSGVSCLIQGKDRPYGVLGAHTKTRRRFSANDIVFIQGMANILGQAIARADIEESLRFHLSQMEALGVISSDISSSLKMNTILKRTIEHAVRLIGGDAGSIAVYDSDNDVMSYPYHYNMAPDFVFAIAKHGRGLAEQVMRTGKSVIIPDYPAHPRALKAFVDAGLLILAAAPIGYKGVNVGAIGVFGFSPDKTFSAGDLRVLEQVGRQTGAAIENARLYQELRELSHSLEQRVKRRTAELEESRLKVVEANKHLRELDRLKSVFIATTSHELRTPLNSIIGFSEMLLEEKGDLDKEQLEDLRAINTAGHQLLSIVNDIIDISKVEAGKVQARPTYFDLRTVVDEALGPFLRQAEEKGLRLTVSVPELFLTSDRGRLRQCLSNLVSNAIKYTKQGSVTLTAEQIGDDVEISVADTGVGIREQDIPRLFQPFERVFLPETSAQPGVGLGLYLVKKLTEETLGGSVMIRSVYGEGTTLTLKVPRDISAQRAAA